MDASKLKKLQSLREIVNDIFEKAKAKDEFEYACALLPVTNIKGPGWDSLQESYTLLFQTLTLANTVKDDDL